MAKSDDPEIQILDYQNKPEGHFNVGNWFLDSIGNANEDGITVLNTEATANGDLYYGKWKDPNQTGVSHETSHGIKPNIIYPTEFWP